MAGATPEEVLALTPPGWLVRPFPGGHPGFRMMSPGRLPGSLGTISSHGPTPEFRCFTTRPPLPVFILNSVLEHPLLVEVRAGWSNSYGGIEDAFGEIPPVAPVWRPSMPSHAADGFADDRKPINRVPRALSQERPGFKE